MPSLALPEIPALRSRNFRLFLSGQFISLCGTWMQSVAHGWLVLQLTNSPFQVGVVAMLGTLPILLFTLYGGVLADRIDKRRAIIVLQALMLMEAVALGFLVQTHRITVPWIMALAFFFGTLSAFEVPTRQAFFNEIVPPGEILGALALNSAIFNVARVIGPALAGTIISLIGPAGCFYANAVSYVAVLWGLFAMCLPRAVITTAGGSLLAAFREGVRFMTADRWPRLLMLQTAVLTIFGFCFQTMLPVFARDQLHLNAVGFGVIVASVGVGAACAALALAAYGGELHRGRLAIQSATAFGFLLAIAGLAPNEFVAAVLFVLAGAALALTGICANTLLQQLAPPHLRGRAMGFYSFVVMGMAPLGSLQIGWVSEHLGVRVAFIIGGLVSAGTGLLTWRAMQGAHEW
jgi:MFS family permease